MRIAHVVRQYYPSIGGFEEVVKNLCKYQKSQGHQPFVITLNKYFKNLSKTLQSSEIIDGIEVIRIPFIGSTRYPIAPMVLKHLNQADVVHVHAIDFFYDFLAFTKVIHQKKMVVTTHGGFFHTNYASTLKKVFFKTITRFSSFFYHKVIASSENDQSLFRSIVHSNKLITIENGVDVKKLFVDNKSSFPPVLLYFGRWSSNKGIYKMLDFVNMLVRYDKKNRWHLLLAGRPYDLSEENVTKNIALRNLEKHVSIFNNPSTEELKALSLKASYFISLSEFEGFGIAPIEAMSAGLTPVLSTIPPFIKLIKQAGLGVIVDDASEESASKLVNHYHSNQFSSIKLQNVAFQYSWDDANQQYLKAYDD